MDQVTLSRIAEARNLLTPSQQHSVGYQAGRAQAILDALIKDAAEHCDEADTARDASYQDYVEEKITGGLEPL